MTFFIDHNLSARLAAGMKAFGEDVTHLTDHFDQDADDTEWLKYVGDNKLLLVTRDERIRWHPAELSALKSHKVGAFFLGGKSRNRCQLVRQLVRNWPRMKELGGKTRRPFAFRVPPSGAKLVPIKLS